MKIEKNNFVDPKQTVGPITVNQIVGSLYSRPVNSSTSASFQCKADTMERRLFDRVVRKRVHRERLKRSHCPVPLLLGQLNFKRDRSLSILGDQLETSQ